MNNLLSICIPTYNRAEKLRDYLEFLIGQVEKHGIAIYVSDNASTDDTQKVVSYYKELYPYIIYNRNDKNYGADFNITSVLRLSTSSFSWLMSDDDRILAGSIDGVLNIIKSDTYDLIIVNGGELSNADRVDCILPVNGRVDNLKSNVYTDNNSLLVNLGWHMTWISSLIFSSNLIRNGRFEKYQGTSLVQFGVLFDYFAHNNFRVYWHDKPIIYGVSNELFPSWIRRMFEIWAKNWCDVINALPSTYSLQSKQKAILMHGLKSKIFLNWKSFYSYRKHGIYNYDIFIKYKNYLKQVTEVPMAILFIIALMPNSVIKLIRNVNNIIGRFV